MLDVLGKKTTGVILRLGTDFIETKCIIDRLAELAGFARDTAVPPPPVNV